MFMVLLTLLSVVLYCVVSQGLTQRQEVSDEYPEDMGISYDLPNGGGEPGFSDDGLLVLELEEQNQREEEGGFELLLKHGVDTRQYVENTKSMPFRSIGQIGDHCSGTVIGRRHVLTAAHCIIATRSSKSQFYDLSFAPARNDLQEPFGRFQKKEFFVPDEYFESDEFQRYDYAVLVLSEDLPKQIIPISLQNDCPSNTPMPKYRLNIPGYPWDKYDTMWISHCENIKINCSWQLFAHTCDTTKGMSGSPMINIKVQQDGSRSYSIKGIHVSYDKDRHVNVGIGVTEEVKAQISSWTSPIG